MNRKDLLTAIDKRMTLRVTLRTPKGEHRSGFPLDFSKDFWLIQEESDFRTLGYVVVPTRNIAALRFGKFERAMERMLHGEGLAARVKLPKKIDLNSFETLFGSLRARRRNIIIEASKRRRSDSDFHIGQIVDFGGDHVRLHNFSALGKWDRAPSTIHYADICRIEFDSPYIKVFSKYLPAMRRAPS